MTGLIGKYGSNYKSLLKLAIPIIIGQLGGIITGLADTIMVGQHSTAELAASSFVISSMYICSAQLESLSCGAVSIVITGAMGNLPAGFLNLLLKLGREIILSGLN